jgi:hypothetical protein
MADFIAVIRRAVDGLSDNSPEMRAKVYEKARAAVQRQLDSMTPRPADDMIARQMAKLGSAIDSVEANFREDEPPQAPEPEPVADLRDHGDAVEEDHSSAAEPDEVVESPDHALHSVAAPVEAHVETSVDEPEPEEVVSQPDHANVYGHGADQHDDAGLNDGYDDVHGAGEVAAESYETPDYQESDDYADEAVGSTRIEEPTHYVSSVSDYASDALSAKPDADTWQSAAHDMPFEEPVDLFAVPSTTQPVARHHDDDQAIERPAVTQPRSSWEIETVEDPWHEERAELNSAAPNAPSVPVENRGEWENFEKIIGLERAGAAGSAAARSGRLEPRGRQFPEDDGKVAQVVERLRENPGKPVVASERRGSAKIIAAVVGGLLVLGGVSYLGWRFSDNILNFVDGSGQSATKANTASSNTSGQEGAAPATGSQAPTTANSGTAPAGQQANTGEPAAAGPDKFTQRLMSDGTETDPGSANEQPATAGAKEGTTVAAQTEKPAEAAAPSTSAPAAKDNIAPVADAQPQNTEKMFLYEERIGQASPTALEGTTVWTEQTDSESGSNSKMVQANIAIPGRNLSAIITFKRNMDKSLPASHIIELTFSLPKDFEGGGIESVLRISMKQKEQDQGTPLVAVPAKITDYFHMVALNSLPEAVKTNMELLKDRDWIDIPITYTNGRRALLTLQKGTEGKRIFDEVLASWENAPPPVQ